MSLILCTFLLGLYMCLTVFKMLLETERGECEGISILLLMHIDAHNKVHWPSILQTMLLDPLVLSRWCYLWRKTGLLLFSPNTPSPFPSWSGRTSVERWLAMSRCPDLALPECSSLNSSSVGLRVFPQLPVLLKFFFFFMAVKCFFPLSIEIITCFFPF